MQPGLCEENMNAKRLGAEIRRLRKTRNNGQGASLREVEKTTKINNAYLSLLENGEIETPSPQRLHKLAEYFGVPYERLMVLAGYMKEKDLQQSEPPGVRMPAHAEWYFRQANLSDSDWEKVVSFTNSYVKPPKNSGNK
jgi:transcriptional regulator with XRE-family HTH domain